MGPATRRTWLQVGESRVGCSPDSDFLVHLASSSHPPCGARPSFLRSPRAQPSLHVRVHALALNVHVTDFSFRQVCVLHFVSPSRRPWPRALSRLATLPVSPGRSIEPELFLTGSLSCPPRLRRRCGYQIFAHQAAHEHRYHWPRRSRQDHPHCCHHQDSGTARRCQVRRLRAD